VEAGGGIRTRFGAEAGEAGEANVLLLLDVSSMCLLVAADLVHGSCPWLVLSRLSMVRFG
jgi:hypothetical protein